MLKSEPPNLWTIVGDPTEGALLTLAGKARLDKSQMEQHLPRVGEFPFSSERKRMSVICRVKPECNLPIPKDTFYWMFTKGSSELVLARCNRIQVGNEILPLTQKQRTTVLRENEDLALQGIRVLGFAARELDVLPPENSDEATEQGLIWLGLVGMLDAPRPEVRSAVARCRQAGIRPVMITGDHQLTAVAIATDLGIVSSGARALSGQELEHMPQTELESIVEDVSVYARVSPNTSCALCRRYKRTVSLWQ